MKPDQQTEERNVIQHQEVPKDPQNPLQVASEVISIALDTIKRQFKAVWTFNQAGRIQWGKYQSGVSGEIVMSSTGIIAKNKAGTTIFNLHYDPVTKEVTFTHT